MRTVNFLDLAPYRRSTVGFDRLLDLMNKTEADAGEPFPAFDIERLDEGVYQITLALPGFRPEEIEIVAQQNKLTVTGIKADERADESFIHRGIVTRSFERQFQIADFVVVESATFDNGLLVITLRRQVPEAMKPRKVEITPAPVTSTNATDASQVGEQPPQG